MVVPFCMQCGQVMKPIQVVVPGIRSFFCANCGFQLNIGVTDQGLTSSQSIPPNLQRPTPHPMCRLVIQHIGDKIQRTTKHQNDNNPPVFTLCSIGDFKWLLSEAFRNNLDLFENSPMTGGQLVELMAKTNIGLLRRLYNTFDFQLTENYFR